MPHKVVIHSTLVETDSPELVIARDGAGGHYLALLAERSDLAEGSDFADRFLCVAISIQRFNDLCAGRIDLRDAFVRNENGEAFAGDFDGASETPTLNLTQLGEIPDQWLPARGFPLADWLPQQEHAVEGMVSEALQKRISVGKLELHPPEAFLDPRIDSYHLVTGLRLFQDLIIRAGKKAFSALNETKEETRSLFDSEDMFVFQVLPAFKGGSFIIQFESKPGATNLIGETPVGMALTRLDQITEYIDDPERALPILKQNSGHLMRAYQAMLNFVAEKKVPLVYQWADPSKRVPIERRIGVDAAARTHAVLVARQDLSAVETTFVGRFVDLGERARAGRWKLVTGEKKRITGRTIEGAGDLLDDVIFRTRTYRVVCEERLESQVAAAKPRTIYFLKEKPVPVQVGE